MIIAIPLYAALIIYIIFLLGYAFFSFFAIYHLLRFGFNNLPTFLMIFIYVGFSVIVLFISWQAVSEIDWLRQITIFEYTGSATPYF